MYTCKLDAFEGPLDLLLHLIEKAKIDIKDIFVSEITGQYIAYIEDHQSDMEDVSEFLTMAATLLYIKSKKLIPKAPVEEDEEDLEEKLIFQLEEYKKYKAAAEQIKWDIEHTPKVYTKFQEEFFASGSRVELEGITLDALTAAYQKLLNNIRLEEQLPDKTSKAVMRKDKYTVWQKMDMILTRLTACGEVFFEELFDGDDRGDMVVTFLALLELLNHGKLSVVQDVPFGRILVQLRSKANG